MLIRLKVLVACLGFLSVTVALGAFSRYQESEIGTLARNIYDNAFIGTDYAQKAQTAFVRFAAARRGTDATLTDGASHAQLDKLLDELDVASERAITTKGRDAAEVLRDKIVSLQAAPSDAVARRHLDEIDIGFERLVQKYAADAFAYRARTDDLMAQGERWLLIAIAASVVLVFLIAIVLEQTIVPPVKRAVAIAMSIAEGRLDNAIRSRGRSETSRLLTALATMQKALAASKAAAERAAEAEDRRKQQHLEHAQRIAATGSSEIDLATGRREWTEELCRIAGVDRASFVLTDENFFALVRQEDRERLRAAEAQARNGMRPPPMEFVMVRPDGGMRALYVEMDLIRDEAGRPERLLSVFKDVTALRAAEQREKDMGQQLLHAQKLDALGTIAGGVAHDLNNILVPIFALGKMMVKRFPEESRERRDIATIIQASARARDLVQQILAFSRKDAPTREVIDLAELTRQSLKMLRASVPSTIVIDERIAMVPPIHGDAGQLHQVIMNFVTNAAQAIGYQHGTITIELAAVEGERRDDQHGQSRRLIRLSVSDTGCGMDEATVARVFEPFFTTKPVGQGTGLGLSVVHGIITEHGGRLSVKSRVGRGTTFEVYLPAYAADETGPAEPGSIVRLSPAGT